jgi:hypothetical protein
MNTGLSKKEKAIMRQLIEKGVQAEFAHALQQTADITEQWKQGKKTNREAYYELFQSIKQNDKFIAMRYDGITGSRYLNTVIAVYHDKHICEEDLMELRVDLREYIIERASVIY